MSSKFVHLHTHSHYSLLNALPKIDALVDEAKKNDMPALALTDNCNLYGAIEFYQACKKAGVKPIIGIDAYVAYRSRHDKTSIDKERYRLVLLAENDIGYKNLIKLVTAANLEGFYYKPRIDRELLEKYHEGLIAIAPSFSSDILQSLKLSRSEQAIERVEWYKKTFNVEPTLGNASGETQPEALPRVGNFFLEITHHPEIAGHEENMKKLLDFARETNTPVVAAHDVYYITPSDRSARETLMAVQNDSDISDKLNSTSDNFSFISPKIAEKYFKAIPDALENCAKIADRCNVEISIGKWFLPNYIVPSGLSYDEELRRITTEGLANGGLEQTPELLERMEYELKIITDKGYAPYFLVVSDLLQYAHEHGILTTIRGSVAGSLVTFLAGITNVNPLVYNLPFERFLNPERPSAPDIDMDFADNRRDEMIEYARQKYGHDKVAQIGTFGTMAARGAVRDVTRALGFPYSTGDMIAKLIPMGAQGFPMTLERALKEVPELKEIYKTDADVKTIIDMAKKIEGCARHISVHAAGVVISPTPLTDYVPLQYDTKGDNKIITQYDMHAVGEDGVGLLKFDFLGIRNLSILADAVHITEKIKGVKIDIEHVPVDDKKTFEMLARGETIGLFQLNGDGMTRSLKELRPTTIHDINVMVALYRPGPMMNIEEYIARKHGTKPITYMHPKMKDFLDRTYGVLVYQDDLLMTAIEVAGYTWGEVDKFRKAIGKKIREEMAKQHVKFVEGCVFHGGMKREKAEELWNLFEPFQGYGFNKCISGDTIITDTKTGSRYSIKELFEKNKKISVQSLSLSGKNKFSLIERPSTHIIQNGIKEVFELTTRSGKKIKATANHPFYTINGWKNLEELKVGIRIAIPRIIKTKSSLKIDPRKAAALGYLLSEGNLCHPHGIYFYSSQENEVLDFIASTLAFENIKCTIDRKKNTIAVYCGQQNHKNGNQLFKWIREMGLAHKKATEKFIPQEVFQWTPDSQIIFLAKLWQGDGSIAIKNGLVYYATSSYMLACQVSHLLLRFGIFSTIHKKNMKYRDDIKIGFAVIVTHRDNLVLFAKHIGPHLIGKKKEDILTLINLTNHLSSVEARGTKDTIPKEILTVIREEMLIKNISIASLVKNTGLAERLFSIDKKKIGYTRDVISLIAESINSPILKFHAESDIHWDEIVSIEKKDPEMTFDLSVAPHANFVANDIIVHNSHAASYGKVAYQTAYMKANFPAIYMSAVLTAESGNIEMIAEIISECKRMGIPVLPPDINESFEGFTVIENTHGDYEPLDGGTGPKIKDSIRFGLTTIKNFGEGIAAAIITERKANGRFATLSDFLRRITDKNLNKKSLESLIKAGALDAFGENIRDYRHLLLHNLDRLLTFNKEERKKETDQDSLFSLMAESNVASEINLETISETSTVSSLNYGNKLSWEKELLGLYISGHPLDDFEEKMSKLKDIKSTKETAVERQPVVLAGIIESLRETMTKKGDKMIFMKLTDKTDFIDTVVFPKILEEFQDILVPDNCIVIKGTLSLRNGEKSVLVEKVKMME